MSMELERLSRMLGEPTQRPAVTPWERSVGEVGFMFPSDYREFVDRYGGVRINGELSVPVPTLRSYGGGSIVGFPGFVRRTTDGIAAELAADEDCPYPVHPEPGGLLSWGSNLNADQFFWLTEGDDPDAWPVVAFYRSLEEWDRFDGGFTAFLLAVLDGTYAYADEVAPRSPDEPLWQFHGDWNWVE
ncbi:hypothetical protein ACFV0O_39400 [Kitasatospora sp. NPDC059577]|uniref:hypothetical protein n=1 Tax=Kitasatospora sp. NPDC059577 TaxID=3346873 RepID=UPI0036986A5E